MLINHKSSKQLLQHKKVMFCVIYCVIQVGITRPELAKSSLEVLAFEVIKPRPTGLPVLEGTKSSWVVTQLK